MNGSHSYGSRRVGGRAELVVLTGGDRTELAARARAAAEHARSATDRPLRDWAADVTAANADGALALAVVGESLSEMSEKLRHASEKLGDPKCTRINDRSGIFFTAHPLHPSGGRVALLFPGEGSQYPGMLADLCIRFEAARRAFDRADRAFENHPRRLLPSQIAFGKASADRIWDMDSAVEIVFSGNAAVHAVLSACGLKPDIVVGHSTGDYSALFASGAIRVTDDAGIVDLMLGLNTIYQELGRTTTLPERALLAVGAGEAAVLDRLLELTPGLDLAMDNCPHQRVICGTPEALADARERLAAEGAIVEQLAFRRGYHTEAYRPALPVLQPFFDTLPLQAPAVELWSCASAGRVPDDLEALRKNALEQWAQPVRFTETVQRLWDSGVRIFVECGARGNLTGFVKDILRDRPHLAVACDGANRPTVTHLLFALGQLTAHRVPVDLSPLRGARIPSPPVRGNAGERSPRRPGPVLTLATGWPEFRLSAATASKVSPPRSEAPRDAGTAITTPAAPASEVQPAATDSNAVDPRSALVASHFAVARRMIQAQERVLTALMRGTPEVTASAPVRLLSTAQMRRDGNALTAAMMLSARQYPFLVDHTLGGRVSATDPALTGLPVMPFTMTLEIAAEAALELVPGTVCIGFDNVVAKRWIVLEPGARPQLVVNARRGPQGVDGVEAVSVEIGVARPDGGTGVHFNATVRLARAYPSAPAARAGSNAAQGQWDRDRVYRQAMFHGPLFQGIERVTVLNGSGAEATLEVIGRNGLLAGGEPALAIDPVLLDQPGQLVGVWTADRLIEGFVIFPTQLKRLDLFSPPLPAGSRLRCHAAIRLTGEAGVISDLEIEDGAGRVHARFTGWEDKRFDVPPTFLAFMLNPRSSSLCNAVTGGASGETGVRVSKTDLPSGFAARGGIWQQVLAGLILSRRERESWCSVSESAGAGQWLIGRLAAKDAAQRWLADRGMSVPPADIVVMNQSNGALNATGEWSGAVGGALDLTIRVVDGETVAVAALSGRKLPGATSHEKEKVPSAFR